MSLALLIKVSVTQIRMDYKKNFKRNSYIFKTITFCTKNALGFFSCSIMKYRATLLNILNNEGRNRHLLVLIDTFVLPVITKLQLKSVQINW